jgi:putative drug exporter of the RND superfamily
VVVGVDDRRGLLLDTLIVRTFLMPSLVALLGRWFWWPRLPSRLPGRRFAALRAQHSSANWATRRVRSSLSN